jgi:hypothetical protein
MRDYVEDPTTAQRHDILESYVTVEIENAAGERLTVRRNVVATTDKRLVSVVEGPELSEGPGHEWAKTVDAIRASASASGLRVARLAARQEERVHVFEWIEGGRGFVGKPSRPRASRRRMRVRPHGR